MTDWTYRGLCPVSLMNSQRAERSSDSSEVQGISRVLGSSWESQPYYPRACQLMVPAIASTERWNLMLGNVGDTDSDGIVDVSIEQ